MQASTGKAQFTDTLVPGTNACMQATQVFTRTIIYPQHISAKRFKMRVGKGIKKEKRFLNDDFSTKLMLLKRGEGRRVDNVYVRNSRRVRQNPHYNHNPLQLADNVAEAYLPHGSTTHQHSE